MFEQRGSDLSCMAQAGLLAYLLRIDERSGLGLAETALGWRSEKYCYQNLLGSLGWLQWSPGIEKLAIQHLSDDPRVAGNAAIVLSTHGSVEAEEALWKRFADWAQEHADEAAELDRANEGYSSPLREPAIFERQLASALMNGMSWRLNPNRARRLDELCLTDMCRRLVTPFRN